MQNSEIKCPFCWNHDLRQVELVVGVSLSQRYQLERI